MPLRCASEQYRDIIPIPDLKCYCPFYGCLMRGLYESRFGRIEITQKHWRLAVPIRPHSTSNSNHPCHMKQTHVRGLSRISPEKFTHDPEGRPPSKSITSFPSPKAEVEAAVSSSSRLVLAAVTAVVRASDRIVRATHQPAKCSANNSDKNPKDYSTGAIRKRPIITSRIEE